MRNDCDWTVTLLQAQHLDIISFNRYNAWYSNSGHLNMITQNVITEATNWHNKHQKPILMSEYGADTIEGLHIVSYTAQRKLILHTKNIEFTNSFSCRHLYGQKNFSEIYCLATLKPLMCCEMKDFSLGNLFGILPISRLIKVNRSR